MDNMKYTFGVSDNLRIPEPSQVETKRTTHVAEQMQIQEKLISELASVIDRLEYNLAVVSRPTEHINPVEQKEESIVALASNIRSNNNFLIRNIQRLDSLIQSLEL